MNNTNTTTTKPVWILQAFDRAGNVIGTITKHPNLPVVREGDPGAFALCDAALDTANGAVVKLNSEPQHDGGFMAVIHVDHQSFAFAQTETLKESEWFCAQMKHALERTGCRVDLFTKLEPHEQQIYDTAQGGDPTTAFYAPAEKTGVLYSRYSREEITTRMQAWMIETWGRPMDLDPEERDRWMARNGMLYAFLCDHFDT
jgi:hypothetical protein